MGEKQGPERLFELRAEIAKALSHPIRLKMIDILAKEGDKCVRELTESLELSQSSTSKHLKTLKSSGVVSSRKEGVKTYYSLATPCVNNFFRCMDKVIRENLQNRGADLLNHVGRTGGGEDETT
ncbi:MAG: metalloregulator ArsR/SmtB family transcription factor [Candidatus Bipolaricaulota bacterium]|nr:winged helix-turn-helix transcriptional regulator [Candidatus Bipolaricaulota bacterium]MBS3791412.1 winged helix-turn-helix transcriptional regulator [Candidatus Bipolaricaulota bacterium]